MWGMSWANLTMFVASISDGEDDEDDDEDNKDIDTANWQKYVNR